MNDGIVSIPCEDAGDGKVVVSLDDYRRIMAQGPEMMNGSALFRKTVLDAFGLEPSIVGLDENYEIVYTEIEPIFPEVRIGDDIFPAQWGKIGQSPLEWAHSRRGRLSIWFSNTRDSIGRRLYSIVSGRTFPTEDWWS